ncbi:hypothetical protein [Streptomyces enissocaesilis]|uniref:hypothetical protein n=1 Tax=Streptomyces enissocaesilis TaxID=332589 RepID=UPI0031E3DC26
MPGQPAATGIGGDGDDAGGLDDLATRALEGDGEAAAAAAVVRVGAGLGRGGLDQHGSRGLVEREQGPHLLLDAGRVT